MELKDLTMEALRQQRPDLVTKLEEAARAAAKTEADTAMQSLRESVNTVSAENKTLRESFARITAKSTVVEKLAEAKTLPDPAKIRVKALLEAAPLPMKDGVLDADAWSTRIKEAIQAEQDYLTSLGTGGVKDAGASGNTSTISEAVKAAEEALDRAFGIAAQKEDN